MIRGTVAPSSEPLIDLIVEGPSGHTITVTATVDTGFNGFLMLPPLVIAAMSFPSAGDSDAILGDGSVVKVDAYAGTVHWHGKKVQIHVLESSGNVLLGMSLLGGSRLTVEAIPGGAVTIEELP